MGARIVPAATGVRCLVVWGVLLMGLVAPAAEKYELAESVSDSRPFDISIRMDLDGHVQAAVGDTKSVAMKLTGQARLQYAERRLESLGRESSGFRSVRHYSAAEFDSQVADQKSQSRLRPELRRIVVEGQTDGLQLYSTAGQLTYEELELIRPPVDSLTALALLPADPVDLNETWETPRWALQFLTSMEAVEKHSMTCKLESVEKDVARVGFTGEINGAILGAKSEIKLSGHYLFDLAEHCLKHVELTQTETRTVGAVTPGLKVTAKAVLSRRPAPSVELTDQAIEGIPKEPGPELLLLALEAPDWGIRLFHDRLWHLFHQGSSVAVLRLMDRGSLIAQCNVSQLGLAPPGKHVAEKQFQEDVKKAIGEGFQKIELAEIIPTEDKRFVYRVIVSGEASQKTAKEIKKIPVTWIYYLIANGDGRQLVLVFTVENTLVERLLNRDINLALGIDFIPRGAAGK